jgi:gliding motility-associated lipoprotein GldB
MPAALKRLAPLTSSPGTWSMTVLINDSTVTRIVHGLCLIMLIHLLGCNSNNHAPSVDKIEVPFAIERWDRQLFSLQTKNEVKDFLESHPQYSNEFFHVDQYPHDSLAVNYLNSFLNNPGSGVLQQEIDEVYGELEKLYSELELAFKHLLYYYPDLKLPSIATAVTGFAGNDLFVSDSIIIIGLDYYLGETATFRPLDFPQYILKRYQPEYIIPSIILLMSSGFNKTNVEDNTMLAEMIHFGKAYYFAKQILPATPDSLLIGYSGEDLLNVSQNQDVIWAHFVEKKLLYETSHFIKKKYMDERPKTLEIGNKCPGRIGEWLGWEIVDKFAKEEEDLSLPFLMETSDAQKIFMQSKYKPQLP